MVAGRPDQPDSSRASIRALDERRSSWGPYRLVRILGRGGAGIVYEAVEEGSDARVAIKLFRSAEVADFDVRPLREASIHQILRHPNIVAVHESGAHDGVFGLVMELVEGISLAQLIEARRRQSPAIVTDYRELVAQVLAAESARDLAHRSEIESRGGVRYETGAKRAEPLSSGKTWLSELAWAMAGVAEALAYAHCLGVVHRDIKPGNLLVDRSGEIRIGDFGIARGLGFVHLTRTGSFLGTPAYASPEQASGLLKVGAGTDIWSFGVTLYELSTLSLPFRSDDPATILVEVQKARITPPRRLDHDIPIDLERIITRCLEPDPGLRYQDASDLARDLLRFASGQPLTQRKIPLSRRLIARLRRPTRRSLGLAIGLLLAAVGIGAAGRRAWDYGSKVFELAETRRSLESLIIETRGAIESDQATPEMLEEVMAVARRRFIVAPDDATLRHGMLRLGAYVASAKGQHVEAVRLLEASREHGVLEGTERELGLREAFAAGLMPAAESFEVAGDAPSPDHALLRKFLAAYRRAEALPDQIVKCLPIGGVAGFGSGAVALLRDPMRGAGRISVIEVDRLASGVDLPELPASSAITDLAAGTIDPLHGPELFAVAADGSVWTLEARAHASSERGWRKLLDSSACAAIDPRTIKVAFLPADSGMKAPPRLILGRGQRLTIATLAGGEPGQGSERPRGIEDIEEFEEYSGSDITLVRSVAVDGESAVILGSGPWNRYGFTILRPVGRIGLRSIAEATMGATEDVVTLEVDGIASVAAATGGSNLNWNAKLFGPRSPWGWEPGVHLLSIDRVTRSFIPLSAITMRRAAPTNVRLHARAISRADAREILVARAIGPLPEPEALETLLARIVSDGYRPRLRPMFTIPGFVVGLIDLDGGVGLVLRLGKERTRFVRIEW